MNLNINLNLKEILNYEKINKVLNCNNIPTSDHNENIKEILKKYITLDGNVNYSQNDFFGRNYCNFGASLQYFQRDIRIYLADNNYIDLDIVNCHPVLLEQLFKKYKILVPKFLKEYNKNKNRVIKSYNLKDKLSLIKIINNETTTNYNPEILDLHAAIYKKLFPKLLKDYPNLKLTSKKNAKGSLFAKILQDIENGILMTMVNYIQNNTNVIIGTLVFDGIMLERNTVENVDNLLLSLETEIKLKTNFSVKLIEKEMKSSWEPNSSLETEHKTLIMENFNEPVNNLIINNESIESCMTNSLTKQLVCQCSDSDHVIKIDKNGYCLKCKKCLATFPKNSFINIPSKFKDLSSRFNIIINNTVNNIINYTKENLDFEIVINSEIFNDENLEYMVNDCFQGFKINSISKLLKYIYKDHIWSGSKWYYFDGTKWKSDKSCIQFKRVIISKLCDEFFRDKIYSFYKKNNDPLVKTIKTSLINLLIKLNSVRFKNDIIEESKQYYEGPDFELKLNSKKHLLPFNNGVFDLLTNTFRSGVREDYIEITLDYDYDESTYLEEVETFINQILPQKDVKDFILKKFSECLNGDIPNTTFMMLIGNQGANGKSQLLNLMKLAMGGFSEKMEVTLITRKRRDANEANTEKIKLMNKRFAYFSEPEDGERINIGLLKELTGSEPIVARGLYQEAKTFTMETKMFLACNELPAIKGEDSALWRRVKVIKFSSTFVEDPSSIIINQFKVDTSIPSRMKVDVRWRQTFMNILLKYYYLDVIEPNSVKLSTSDYREKNDEMLEFTENFIRPQKKGTIAWKTLYDTYQAWFYEKNGDNAKIPNKKKIKLYFEEKVFNQKEYPLPGNIRGWRKFVLIEEERDIIDDLDT